MSAPDTVGRELAEARVEQAIRELIDAYGMAENGVLTDFAIITVQQDLAAEPAEDRFYVSPLLPRPMPLYQLLGLLEHASTRTRARIVAGDRDEEDE